MTVRTIIVLFVMAGPFIADGAGLSGGLVGALPFLVAALLAATLLQALRWRGRTVSAIALEDDYLILPSTLLPLRAVKRLSLVGRPGGGALVIETGRRQHSFLFAGNEGEEAVHDLLARIRRRMTGTRKGEEAWERLCRRFRIEPAAAPWATLALAALIGAVFAVQSFLLPPQTDLALAVAGAAVPARLWGGDPSILLTAGLLHQGRDHFCANLLALLALGPAVERRLGAASLVCLLTVANMATIAAGVVLCRVHPHIVAVGASGMVFALTGALAALRLVTRERPLLGDHVLPWPVWLALLAHSAAAPFYFPTIDWIGHAAGLIAGFLGTLALFRLPLPIRRAGARLCAALLAAALLFDASAVWWPKEIDRRQTAVIGSIETVYSDPRKAREVLAGFAASPSLSPGAMEPALALARRFAEEDERSYGPDSAVAAGSRLLAASLAERRGDRETGRQVAEALMLSGKGADDIDLLLPLLEHWQRGRKPPAGLPKTLFEKDRLSMSFEGRPPWEAAGLFLLRRQNDLIGVFRLIIPPGQAPASPQPLFYVIVGGIDLTGAEMVPLLYDPLYCHCDAARQGIDPKFWRLDPPARPFP